MFSIFFFFRFFISLFLSIVETIFHQQSIAFQWCMDLCKRQRLTVIQLNVRTTSEVRAIVRRRSFYGFFNRIFLFYALFPFFTVCGSPPPPLSDYNGLKNKIRKLKTKLKSRNTRKVRCKRCAKRLCVNLIILIV